MPSYPWLATTKIDAGLTARKLTVLRIVGTPYTDDDIKGAAAAVEGRTELDALIAYLQSLGRARPRGS